MTEVTERAGHIETAAADHAVPAAAVRPGRRTGARAWALAIVAVVLLASIIVLTGTFPRAGSRPRSTTEAPSTTKAPTSTTYRDPGRRFRISYPSGWRRGADKDGGIVLQAGGQNAVGVREFTLASTVDTRSLHDMRAVTDAILASPRAHLTVLASQVVHVGKLTGLYYLYSYPSGDQQGVHAHYFLFSGKRMFTIVCQAVPASGFQTMATTFDAVAQSFVAPA